MSRQTDRQVLAALPVSLSLLLEGFMRPPSLQQPVYGCWVPGVRECGQETRPYDGLLWWVVTKGLRRSGGWAGTAPSTSGSQRSFSGADWVELAAGSFEVPGTLAW